MSKKRSKPRTTCVRCGGPFESAGIERIEFWAMGYPQPIEMKITEPETNIPMRRCAACLPAAIDVVRCFRELVKGTMNHLGWTEAIVLLEGGTKLGSCSRHDLFGDN